MFGWFKKKEEKKKFSLRYSIALVSFIVLSPVLLVLFIMRLFSKKKHL